MEIRELQLTANTIRQHIIRMLAASGSGHPGGSLGMADVFTALYFSALNYRSHEPLWIERDYVVLSNGHICPVLYATLAEAGYFSVDELATLRVLGSRVQGHPHRGAIPGIETTSGPLGSGLSQASGIALGLRMDNNPAYVFCLTSDGEHQEGNHWEAVMLAAKYKLNHLIQIIDRNYIQIEGNTEDVMPLDPLDEKYRAFGWRVIEIDGNRMSDVVAALAQARTNSDAPTVIIAKTVPGKGVSFMEGKYTWHGKAPSKEDAEKALSELGSTRLSIEQGNYE